MGPATRGTTGRTAHAATASYIMLTVTSTRATGSMIWLMDKESTYTQMVLNTRGNGVKTSSTGRVRSDGLMVQDTVASTREAGNMERVNLYSPRGVTTRDSSLIMRYKDMDLTTGLMGSNTQGSGKRIRCMDRGYYLGQMEGYMKGLLKEISGRGMDP